MNGSASDPPLGWSTIERHIIFDVIEVVVGIMGSVTNITVLLAIYKEHRLRTITNCFVGSLAASDVLVGLVVPPIVALSNNDLQISFSTCVICNSLVILLTIMSVLNMLSVSVERFVAIRKPFMYRQWMSNRRALWLVAATWLVATLTGLPPILGWNKGEDGYSRCTFRTVITLEYLVYFVFFVVTLPPLVAMTMIYIYIFRVVRRTRQMTETLMMSYGKDRFKHTLKQSVRGDMGILLVIVVFILCWMPFHITNTFLLFSDSDVPPEFYRTCYVLTRFTPLINPFLFAFGYSLFKVTIKKLLFKRCINIEENTSVIVDYERKGDRGIVNVKGQSISMPSYAEEKSFNIQYFVDEICNSRNSEPNLVAMLQNRKYIQSQQAKQPEKKFWIGLGSKLFQQSLSGDESSMFNVVDMMSEDLDILEKKEESEFTSSSQIDFLMESTFSKVRESSSKGKETHTKQALAWYKKYKQPGHIYRENTLPEISSMNVDEIPKIPGTVLSSHDVRMTPTSQRMQQQSKKISFVCPAENHLSKDKQSTGGDYILSNVDKKKSSTSQRMQQLSKKKSVPCPEENHFSKGEQICNRKEIHTEQALPEHREYKRLDQVCREDTTLDISSTTTDYILSKVYKEDTVDSEACTSSDEHLIPMVCRESMA